MKDQPLLPYALHPDTYEPLTVDAYRAAFGHLSQATQPPAKCPICYEDIELVRAHDRAQTWHFNHPLSAGSPCPLVSPSVPDRLVQATLGCDVEREQANRNAFIDKWVWHFHRMRELAPAYNIDRLIRSIAHADVLHIWAC
ncbi:MAG TPA: hypothetical protein VL424_17945, partial [Pararobbsia sp.]|nr:hypothetical protein [Pararobbsia sp.]